jgi:hypothetical protein
MFYPHIPEDKLELIREQERGRLPSELAKLQNGFLFSEQPPITVDYNF